LSDEEGEPDLMPTASFAVTRAPLGASEYRPAEKGQAAVLRQRRYALRVRQLRIGDRHEHGWRDG
jgi:hypothetical protein